MRGSAAPAFAPQLSGSLLFCPPLPSDPLRAAPLPPPLPALNSPPAPPAVPRVLGAQDQRQRPRLGRRGDAGPQAPRKGKGAGRLPRRARSGLVGQGALRGAPFGLLSLETRVQKTAATGSREGWQQGGEEEEEEKAGEGGMKLPRAKVTTNFAPGRPGLRG